MNTCETAKYPASDAADLLRTLLDTLPDPIFVKDREGRFLLNNFAHARLLGVEQPRGVIGKTDFDFLPGDLATLSAAEDRRVMDSGEAVCSRDEGPADETGRKRSLLTTKLPLRDSSGVIVGVVGIVRNVSALKEAEEKLETTRKELRVASRFAGMAEVATGVLHNVGNVLNSVNVSASVIDHQIRNSHSSGISKLAKLIRDKQNDLARFLTEDDRGRQVPLYLEELAGNLEKERSAVQTELQRLSMNIDHMKEIVYAQQNYAKLNGVTETVALPELIEDALKIHSGAYARHGVSVAREFDMVPAISVDKHKVLQILVNLLHNAKYACDEAENTVKQVTVRLKCAGADRVLLEVADTGVGIAPENMTRIFTHGFTTRKNGHGFGLHNGAITAREMGGSLTARSDGVGKGATFSLELPVHQPKHDQAAPDSPQA
jgi:PAS domain S-box-containing protein